MYRKTKANTTFAYICLSLSKSTDRFYTTFVTHSNGGKCYVSFKIFAQRDQTRSIDEVCIG